MIKEDMCGIKHNVTSWRDNKKQIDTLIIKQEDINNNTFQKGNNIINFVSATNWGLLYYIEIHVHVRAVYTIYIWINEKDSTFKWQIYKYILLGNVDLKI